MSTLADRLQVPRQHDGLSGRTEAERREIAARIEAASRAKEAVEGRTLTPWEIAATLTPEDSSAPRRRCRSCSSWLPATTQYFYRNGPKYLKPRCITCVRRDNTRCKRTEQGKANKRDACRLYMRRRREAEKAAGLSRPESTPRQRLLWSRAFDRRRLARTEDARKRAHIEARIANLTREIDRLAEKQACAG